MKTMEKCSVFLFFFSLSNIILVKCDFIINQEFADIEAKKSLPLILKFLNDGGNTSINYSSGKVLYSELKDNNIQVDLSISITCRTPSEQCDNDKILNCQSLLYVLPDRELRVHSVDCLPNPPDIEEPLALPVQAQPCTGCLSEININAEGVDALVKTTIQHIQSEKNRRYILLDVLKVQQQVVNGVNFILAVRIAPAVCNDDTMECVRDPQEEDVYCLVKFFQKPGYQNPKNIISNNCTKSQTFVLSPPVLEINDINKVGPDTDNHAIHEKGILLKKNERSENDILAELMSQIIPYDQKKDIELVQSNPVKSVESSSVHNLVDDNGVPIISSSTYQEVLATEDEPISLGTDTAGEQDVTPLNPSLSFHASSLDIIVSSSRNTYSNQQNENVEVTSQNIGSEHGNSISAPVGNYESDILEEHKSLDRLRRSVVNSEKFSAREKAAIENIADFVASTLDIIDDDNHKRIVLQVINVKKIRIDDGLFLNMNLRIGVSKCEENDNDLHCKKDLLEDSTKFCKVQVLINEDFKNPKVVKSHCENEKQDPKKANRTSNIRDRRASLGGKNKIDIDDPKIKQYVSEAVNYMNGKLSKGDSPIQVNRVLSATSQVVSGMSYDIKAELSSCNKNENSVDNCSNMPKICNINVWYRAWLNSRIITIDCGGPKLTFDSLGENNRTKRSVPGGWSSKSTDDVNVIPHLNHILKKMDSQSDKDLKLKIKSVVSVSSQVVAGTNWDIKAKVAFSDCLKSDLKDSENCGESTDTFETVCDFKFWEKLPNKEGLREIDNIQVNCLESKYNYRNEEVHSRKRRSSLVGGHNAITKDDPRILKHVNKLLSHLDSQSDKQQKLKIKEVLSATTQVVAGTNWNIRAKVALSDCSKTYEKKIEDCGDNKEDSFETICTFKFWEKLPDKYGVRTLENIQIECNDSKLHFRNKRSIRSRKTRTVGGHNAVPNDDPRIGKHLNKLLPQLDSQSGKENKLKIKEIVSVTSQVVAGTNWNIRAKLVLSDCSKTEPKNSEDCRGNKQDSFETVCLFKFWEKLPDKNRVRAMENIQIECDEPKLNFKSEQVAHFRNKRSLSVGGHSAVPNDDPRIEKNLNSLLPKLDSQSGKEQKLRIKEIISATSQVVAGTNWNIRAKVVLSDCSKTEQKNSENCSENKVDTFETVCLFKFWEKLPDKNGVRAVENIQIECDEPKLNFRNEQERNKRSPLVGGHTVVPNDDPRIGKHLNRLLPNLDSQSGKEQKLRIKDIVSATSQVVAGTNWNIRAIVVLSDCSKTEQKNPQNCGENKVDPFETVCLFKFWEKLPDKNGVRAVENIQIECDEPKLHFRNEQERNKRSLLVGGHTVVPNDDPRIGNHLNRLLHKLDSQSGKEQKLRIKEILSATSQVVAGTNWNIRAKVVLSDCSKTEQKNLENCGENKVDPFETVCLFKFWEKLPDKNGVRAVENIQIACDEPKLNFRNEKDAHFREKRSLLLGGHTFVPNDDPRIGKHLNRLLPNLDSQSGKEQKLKIKDILSATSQVVAGTNWNIRARVVLSDCSKIEEKVVENCGENKQDSFETICLFKFWEKLPDKNGARTLENVQIECDKPKLLFKGEQDEHFRRKRSVLVVSQNAVPNDDPAIRKDSNKLSPELDSQSDKNHFYSKINKRNEGLLGGEYEVDKNDPLIYEYISNSLQQIDLNSPEENKFKVKEVLLATKQLVEGDLWKITVRLVLSDCTKNDVTDWDQCGDLQGAEPKTCVIKIWDRPWIKQGRETHIACENQKKEYTFRNKRSQPKEELLEGDDYNIQFAAFAEFERKYNKHYFSSRERIYRFSVFRENMWYVKQLNKHEQGTATYGPTQFADMSRKEFSKRLGYRADLRSDNEIDFLHAKIPDIELPDSFDWRDKKTVSEVKNQGSCGSCWAFSVTGNVEGQYAIKNGQLLEFSEQELVDCDTVDEGCNGGLMDNAYRQIEKLGGLELEEDYPYDGRNENCHFNKSLARVQLSGAVNISSNETDMAKWLLENGPISIAINANAMQFYMGGVSHPWKFLCNPKSLDHGVLIVGYGVHTYPKFKKSLPYWIVKNSWGTSWGEQGYYRVYRGDGTCGVNQTPSSAILK